MGQTNKKCNRCEKPATQYAMREKEWVCDIHMCDAWKERREAEEAAVFFPSADDFK